MNVLRSAATLVATANADIPNWFVVVMGLCTVFIALICIIVLCNIMSKIVMSLEKKNAPAVPVAPVAKAPAAQAPIENRQELIAAISAVLAEELGTEMSAIRILSFKRV